MGVLTSEPVQVLISINVLLTLSLLFPFVTGVWSLGLPGFMCMGAYASSIATVHLGLPVAAGLALGVVAGAVVTLPFGLLTLRVQGIYLSIATLAAAELITLFFSHYELTGGVMGYTGMPYLDAPIVLGLAVGMVLLSLAIYRSQLGKALIAAGSDPMVASCNGLNVPALRLTALMIGGALAGLAGGIFAHYYSFISPGNFGFNRTVDILLFLVAGGFTPLGAVFGSATLTLVPQFITALESWAPALYGAIVIAIMAVVPDGIFPKNRLSRVAGVLMRKPAAARTPTPPLAFANAARPPDG